ncbi:MAG TPA: hypothetical protein VM638_03545 [Actinomycetota bacterium]|nr:hypothetical protein [Actinomycetota bacterium]
MTLIRRFLVLVLAAGLLAMPGQASAYPRPGRTTLISTGATGAQDWSWLPDISHDGRFIVYESDSAGLVPGDTNGATDVFWHDRATGETRRASVAADGGQVRQGGNRPAVSDDGRYVGFYSYAADLIPGDTNPWADCFLKDMWTGAVELVSVAHDGGWTDGGCFSIQMDSTGRSIVFESYGTNIVPGDTNGAADIFVRDREKGETRRVSVASDGTQADDASLVDPVISADGSVAAFYSTATNLTDDPKHSPGYIYAHDLRTGVTERVAKADDGTTANSGSIFKAISGDGRFVAFASGSTNLTPNDTNVSSDIFVHDLLTKKTRRVNVTSAGAEAEARTLAYTPSLSHDGRFVSFVTRAANLTEGDTNTKDDVFVHDLLTGETEMISVDLAGGPSGESVTGRYNPNEITGTSVISGDGRHVVFASQARDLVAEATTAWRSIFVRDRGPSPGVQDLRLEGSDGTTSVRGTATFGGSVVAAAADPADDAEPPGGDVGAEIVGAELVTRIEREDLLVRIRLESLPGVRAPVLDESRGSFVPSVAGAPVVTYGFRFLAGSSAYEARAVSAPSADPATQSFSLHRCAETCERVRGLGGGIGVLAPEVTIAIPRAELAPPGAPLELSEVTAFAQVGLAEARVPTDAVALGNPVLDEPRVALVVEDAQGERRVVEASLEAGRFAATIGDDERVEAVAACLGARCETLRPPA